MGFVTSCGSCDALCFRLFHHLNAHHRYNTTILNYLKAKGVITREGIKYLQLEVDRHLYLRNV